MRHYNGLADLSMDVYHKPTTSLTQSYVTVRSVWPTAPRLVSLEAVLIQPAPPRLTLHTWCVTDHSEANQYLLLLKVPGDTDTILYLNGHKEKPTLP